MGKLTKEEKAELKAQQKAEKEAQLAEKREKEKEARILAKERELTHHKMDAYQAEHRKEEKIAPEGVEISLQHINKIYPNHVQAVFDFNLDIKEHEFIVFVGPSGCGKSTTLRMIAGLEEISAGDLYISGQYANDLKPIDRDVAMVFQSYALYPNMTVEENLSFGLRIRHVPKEIIEEKVKTTAELLQIDKFLDRKPAALSGGQRQRVALGRAIIREAKVFLMDEPLSNLDAKLRVAMRSEIVRIHNEIGATTIYVTHDQTEAMTMATRIVVMKDGYVQQIGTPREIYNHPNNIFVAGFIGSPAMNMLKANYNNGLLTFEDGYTLQLSKEEMKQHDDFYHDRIEEMKSKIAAIEAEEESIDPNSKDKEMIHEINEYNLKWYRTSLAHYEEVMNSEHHDLVFGIRPEDILTGNAIKLVDHISKPFKLKTTINELLGHEYYVHANVGESEVIAKVSASDEIKAGDTVEVYYNLDHIHLFDDLTTRRIL